MQPTSKRTPSLARQNRIVQILLAEETASVAYLAKALDVSEWTVRRDLKHLEAQRLIGRRYGRADILTSRRYRSFRPPGTLQTEATIAAKERIGEAAAKLVQPGQHVALSAGTTTAQVAAALKRRETQCFVLTNALNIAQDIASSKNVRVTCTGGEVDGDYHTLNGPVAERVLRSHFFDLAILGVSGIALREGLTVNSQLNAVALDLMRQHAKRIVVVADGDKFGEVRFAHLAPLDAIDIIVTDRPPESAYVDHFATVGVELIVAAAPFATSDARRPS